MKTDKDIIDRLDRIEKIVTGMKSKPLSLKEAAEYLGISRSYLYKLTSQERIAHSKPGGKKVYFDKEELDRWALRNPVATHEQIKQRANNYVNGKEAPWLRVESR
jgi:excisionase family DNA binding protein